MVLGMLMSIGLLLAACARPQPAAETTAAGERPTESEADVAGAEAEALPEYKIVTLLPPDAIPAIDNPQFLTAGEADNEYDANELVLGIEIDGDARAYSIPFLSGHEIVNDTVGGRPIAVTW
jgi:hypothetical protein